RRPQAARVFICSHLDAHYRVAGGEERWGAQGGRNRLDCEAFQCRSVDCGDPEAGQVGPPLDRTKELCPSSRNRADEVIRFVRGANNPKRRIACLERSGTCAARASTNSSIK